MEKSTKFPLFRLPFIPMAEVLRLMDVCEQYKMATASKKAKQLVTLSLSRDDFLFTFSVGQVLVSEIWSRKTNTLFKVEIERPALEEYNGMESIRSHIEFLKKVFHLKGMKLKFLTNRPPGLESRFVPFFKEYLVISELSLDPVIDGQTDDALYLYILNECYNCSRLYIYMGTTEDFQLPVSACPKFFCEEEILLNKAHWITVDHLATNFGNVQSLVIGDTLFTLKEANKIIENWTSGSQIEAMIFGLEDGSRFREVFRNIDATEIREVVLSSDVVQFGEGEAFIVKQADGTEALVYEMDDLLILNGNDFSLDLSIV